MVPARQAHVLHRFHFHCLATCKICRCLEADGYAFKAPCPTRPPCFFQEEREACAGSSSRRVLGPEPQEPGGPQERSFRDCVIEDEIRRVEQVRNPGAAVCSVGWECGRGTHGFCTPSHRPAPAVPAPAHAYAYSVRST